MNKQKPLIIVSIILGISIVIACWYWLLWLAPLFTMRIVLFGIYLMANSIVQTWFSMMENVTASQANIEANKTLKVYSQKLRKDADEIFEILKVHLRSGLIMVEDLQSFKFKNLPKNIKEPETMYLPTNQPKNLMDALRDAQRIMVVGGMGSGKTTVLLHLAERKSQISEVTVIDTHSRPSKWPMSDSLGVVGSGRDYNGVEKELQSLLSTMDDRFKEIDEHDLEDRSHPIITLLADEWTMLPEMIPNIKRYSKPLLVESRKASIDFVIAAHDVTVEALGLQKVSGLKQAFDAIVHCTKDVSTGEYKTEVQWGWKSKVHEIMIPPGPYRSVLDGIVPESQVGQVGEVVEEPVIIDLDKNFGSNEYTLPPTPEEVAQVLRSFNQMDHEVQHKGGEFSWNQLCLKIYGKKGGTYNQKIRSILDQYTISYENYL